MPVGVEHVSAFSVERLIAAAARIVQFHIDHKSEDPVDLIVVGVPRSRGDAYREKIMDVIYAEGDEWTTGPRNVVAADEEIEDIGPPER